jgi:hypothetical protein
MTVRQFRLPKADYQHGELSRLLMGVAAVRAAYRLETLDWTHCEVCRWGILGLGCWCKMGTGVKGVAAHAHKYTYSRYCALGTVHTLDIRTALFCPAYQYYFTVCIV